MYISLRTHLYISELDKGSVDLKRPRGEPPPIQNRDERSAKGSPLRSKTVTDGGPRGAPSEAKLSRTRVPNKLLDV